MHPICLTYIRILSCRTCRLSGSTDLDILLRAWLDPVRANGEVILLQENNSYFATEPILKALQSMNAVPLARHLVPAERQPQEQLQPPQQQQLLQLQLQQLRISSGAAGSSALSSDAVPTSVSGTVARHVDAPMYLGDQALYDLRPVAAKERLDLLDKEDAKRYVLS